MEFLKTFFYRIIFWFKIFWKLSPDIFFKILGNLFPLYLGAFTLYIIDKPSLGKILDAQSFIIYSSTFLFSTMYLWFNSLRADNKSSRSILLMLFFFLIGIAISLLYAFLLGTFKTEFDFNYWSYRLFGLTVILYISFECYNYFKKENLEFSESSKDDYDNLKKKFKK